jgi:hypothetical protein
MKLNEETGRSKIAAKIRNSADKLKDDLEITVSEHGPESLRLTGYIPRNKGWRTETKIPLMPGGKKDYIRFLRETKEKEIWIKVSTAGGRSRIYVR